MISKYLERFWIPNKKKKLLNIVAQEIHDNTFETTNIDNKKDLNVI